MVKQCTYLVVILITTLSFFQCQQKDLESKSSSDLQNLKEFPNDLSSFQRSYPFERVNIEAVEKGLKEVHRLKNQRNTSPGFDAAWTNRGPGNTGARVNTVEVHPSDENIIYLGYSTGGVWKTIDGGTNWEPIFDDQPFLTISDIAMDPNDSQTLYVGTGDVNITGYPAIGDGIYKSTDGGDSWTHMGLTEQRIVSKVIVNPSNSDIVYAACMGLPMARNNDRGLYKSLDGGLNWEQVLFVSDQAGIADMVMNPDNPEVIYAASWDRIRNNEESIVSGPNTKIHKTIDGGETWTELTNGLPSGNQGRIGLAMAGTDSDILVAVVVSTSSNLEGVYRTEDAGLSWNAIPTSAGNGLGAGVLGGFGWYFGQVRIHPTNDQRIYVLGVSSWVTNNNGTLWSMATNGSTTTPHVDYHDLVFNFQNDIIVGNDGGAYKRESSSLNFIDIENIPATQVYRVAYDPHRTDNYYGGTQDNGTQSNLGLGANDWDKLLGGDGFQMQFNPVDSNIVYAETQRGNIFRSTNGLSGFISSTSGIGPDDRRHWDMQYFISPHNPDRLYTGTYKVYKSETSDAPMWNTISDDLTDGVIFGDGFHTITTLDESPVVEDLLYVGTTDGNVWRTEDGGTSWDSLHANLPNRYITSVKASPEAADHVYVCVSGYRYDEHVPRLYKSSNRGDTWTSIIGDLPDLAVNDIIILPNQDEQILFVATDGGIFATTNGGTNWEFLGVDIPVVPTYDLEWNEANNELVAGTFGRSIYSYPIDSLLNNLDPTFSISGQVFNEMGEGIDSAIIEVEGDIMASIETDPNGDYQISNIANGSDCEIIPSKNINIRNGFSTFDLVKMRSHLLFIDTLDSPYKIIAGDLTNDGNISTFDIVIGRKVLLFIQDTFINTPSWRFIPDEYEFSNPLLPFADDFPESITCTDIQNGANPDFVGLKVGDVTGDANPLMFGENSDARNNEILDWYTDDLLLEKGKTYQIPFYLSQEEALIGFQMGVEFKQAIEFLGLISNGNYQLDQSNYAFDEKENKLRISWENPYSTVFEKDDIAIYLNIKALSTIRLSELVELNFDVLSSEAYNKAQIIFESKLSFFEKDDTEIKDLLISPNPFFETTSIQFETEIDSKSTLEVYDLNGKLIYVSTKQSAKGKDSFELSSDEIKNSGLYIFQIKTGSNKYTGKVLKH